MNLFDFFEVNFPKNSVFRNLSYVLFMGLWRPKSWEKNEKLSIYFLVYSINLSTYCLFQFVYYFSFFCFFFHKLVWKKQISSKNIFIKNILFLKNSLYNKIKRILHSGSALAFQARGAGSIPAIRSNFQSENKFSSFSKNRINFNSKG